MSVKHRYKTPRALNMLFIFTILALSNTLIMHTPQAQAQTQAQTESKPQSSKGQVMKQKLAPCPKSPNCVNSQYRDDKKHFIEPLQVKDSDLEKNKNKLLEILNNLPRVKVTQIESDYIKTEFTSKYFSFVDDVEFLITDSHIDLRSASRKGYHDLGANRKRVEKIRKLFEQ